MSRLFFGIMAAWIAVTGWTGRLAAGTITVPNGSFESPVTPFVNVNIYYWQKSPEPSGFDDSGGFLWVDETGAFLNDPPSVSDHIDNIDGKQAMWLFAVPTVAVFQDYNTTDANHPVATHNFNALFEVGNAYQLTVAVIGGGGGMLPGETMDISLYYRDSASNMVTVADTTITNDPDIFPVTTHFVDFQATVPTVKATDPWAGQNIGIELASTISPTVSTNDEGGYWDVDNVRLFSFVSPALVNPVGTNGQFQFTLLSDPGQGVEILTSTNATQPLSNWVSLGTLTNVTGSIPFVDTNATLRQRFYQARQTR